MIGRAVGQDQLAAFQLGDRLSHRGIGLERRVVDLVHVGEVIVSAHAVLGHHAAHRGAVAAVISPPDPPRFPPPPPQPGAPQPPPLFFDPPPPTYVMWGQRVYALS